MNEPCEDRKEHESEKLRLMGGLLALSDEMGCVYQDVDFSDEMNATTKHERSRRP